MDERARKAVEFRAPLAKAIRAKALADDATPTDRLAAAVLLLAAEVGDHEKRSMDSFWRNPDGSVVTAAFQTESEEPALDLTGNVDATQSEAAPAEPWIVVNRMRPINLGGDVEQEVIRDARGAMWWRLLNERYNHRGQWQKGDPR